MKKYIAIIIFGLTACQSPAFIDSVGGTPEDQLQNAYLQMNEYSDSPAAKRLALHSTDRAFKAYQQQGNTVGMGDAYNVYGKIYKIFEKDDKKSEQAQLKAISYYKQTNYNPGIAVGYSELGEVQYLQGKKAESCSSFNMAIQKFEEMKTTHPKIQIPMYNPNFKDFGEFNVQAKKDIGCN